jgi:hypothetical protein
VGRKDDLAGLTALRQRLEEAGTLIVRGWATSNQGPEASLDATDPNVLTLVSKAPFVIEKRQGGELEGYQFYLEGVLYDLVAEADMGADMEGEDIVEVRGFGMGDFGQRQEEQRQAVIAAAPEAVRNLLADYARDRKACCAQVAQECAQQLGKDVTVDAFSLVRKHPAVAQLNEATQSHAQGYLLRSQAHRLSQEVCEELEPLLHAHKQRALAALAAHLGPWLATKPKVKLNRATLGLYVQEKGYTCSPTQLDAIRSKHEIS